MWNQIYKEGSQIPNLPNMWEFEHLPLSICMPFSFPAYFHLFPHNCLLISEGKCEMGAISLHFCPLCENTWRGALSCSWSDLNICPSSQQERFLLITRWQSAGFNKGPSAPPQHLEPPWKKEHHFNYAVNHNYKQMFSLFGLPLFSVLCPKAHCMLGERPRRSMGRLSGCV